MSTQLHPRDVTSIRELRRRIHHFAPDIIHAHGFRAGLLSLLAARRSPVPVVVSWHNQASGRGIKQRLEHAVESFIARRADLRSEEHTSELQSRGQLVCRLLLEKK